MVFLGWVKHPYVQLSSPGRQKGQRVGADSGRIHGGFMAQGGSIGFEFARRMTERVVSTFLSQL